MTAIAAPRSGAAVNLLLTGLVAFQAISTDLYLASLPTMVQVFATSEAKVQLTLSVFLLGSALMQLAYGPISDRFGRRPVLRVAIALYVAASLACAMAPTIEALIFFRLMQAVGSCAGVTLGRAVARDLYSPVVAARVLAYMASAMAIAPIIGPMLGSWMTVHLGWQANFLFLAGFGAICLIGLYTLLDETNLHPDPHAIAPKRILANYLSLLGDRVYLGYALAVTLAYCGIFSFISGSSFTLIDVLGLPTEYFGFCFGARARMRLFPLGLLQSCCAAQKCWRHRRGSPREDRSTGSVPWEPGRDSTRRAEPVSRSRPSRPTADGRRRRSRARPRTAGDGSCRSPGNAVPGDDGWRRLSPGPALRRRGFSTKRQGQTTTDWPPRVRWPRSPPPGAPPSAVRRGRMNSRLDLTHPLFSGGESNSHSARNRGFGRCSRERR